MDVQLKQRVVGAAVLAALAVIFVPMLLDDGRRHEPAPLPPPAAVVPDPGRAKLPAPPSNDALAEIEKGMTATPEELARMPVEPRVPPDPEAATREAPPRTKAAVAKTAAGTKPDTAGHATKKADATPRAEEQWVVQLGTYVSEAKAGAMLTKLKQAGLNATLQKPQEAGKPYRLQSAPAATREKAEALRKRIEKDFEIKGIVKRVP